MTAEQITERNQSYISRYGLSRKDVDIVNEAIDDIRRTRVTITGPQPGDRIAYTTRHGDFHPNALIEKVDDNGIHICLDPYIPFIFCKEDKIRIDVSGGPFARIEKQGDLKEGRISEGEFKIWGSQGPCGAGALHFSAEVTRWTYSEPDPLYDGMTTERHMKMYVTEHKEPVGIGYLITAESYRPSFKTAFKTREEYETFLHDHQGREFPNPHWGECNTVAFCLIPKTRIVPESEWKQIQAPVITREYIGHPHIEDRRMKQVKDDECGIMYTYLIAND